MKTVMFESKFLVLLLNETLMVAWYTRHLLLKMEQVLVYLLFLDKIMLIQMIM